MKLFSPRGILRISAADGESSVLLLDEVLPVAVLDAHPRRFAQLEEESLGQRRVAGDSPVGHLPVFPVLTLQVHLPALRSLNLNNDHDDRCEDKDESIKDDVSVDNDLYGGIGSLIALKPGGAGSLVPDEALLALQHQDRSVDQVEVIPGQRQILELFIMGKKHGCHTCCAHRQCQRWQRDVPTSLSRQTCRCRP